jgi:endo-1,4-beta-xylanase
MHSQFKVIKLVSLAILVVIISCKSNINPVEQVNEENLQFKKWIVSDPVFTNGGKDSFDEIAVKDPTIVFFNGKYHMFYTSIASYETRTKLPFVSSNGAGTGYVSAKSLDNLNNAERFNLCEITKSVIVAPEVFYFGPQKLWYLIAQTPAEGRPNLQPIYLTNPDIGDPYGWSKPQILKTSKTNDGFWIDFWVICDESKAHLFYTDHEGSLFRFECPLNEFPGGFADKKEETVLTQRGENSIGRWRLHEASHIYYVKSTGKYLNLLEAVYPHPTRKYYWESRNRFMFAMMADKLEGPWYRVEPDNNEFMGDPAYLFTADGTTSELDQVSHPELIRSGYDQRLEIDDLNLELLFQAFDADTIGSGYDYTYLPWKLRVMQNYAK